MKILFLVFVILFMSSCISHSTKSHKEFEVIKEFDEFYPNSYKFIPSPIPITIGKSPDAYYVSLQLYYNYNEELASEFKAYSFRITSEDSSKIEYAKVIYKKEVFDFNCTTTPRIKSVIAPNGRTALHEEAIFEFPDEIIREGIKAGILKIRLMGKNRDRNVTIRESSLSKIQIWFNAIDAEKKKSWLNAVEAAKKNLRQNNNNEK